MPEEFRLPSFAQLAGTVEYTNYISGWEVRPHTKQSNWKAPVMPLFTGPFWPWVVASDRVLSMGQIELFDI